MYGFHIDVLYDVQVTQVSNHVHMNNDLLYYGCVLVTLDHCIVDTTSHGDDVW